MKSSLHLLRQSSHRAPHIVAAAALLSVAACSYVPAPLNWYHELEGGKIAEQRPPPPNPDAPYPNLSIVPPRPAPPDTAARSAMQAGLVADRANAQYSATLNPLVASPPVAPKPPTPRSAVADDTASMSMAGATPPPPPATPARSAPTKSVASADLPPPTAAAPQAAAPSTAAPAAATPPIAAPVAAPTTTAPTTAATPTTAPAAPAASPAATAAAPAAKPAASAPVRGSVDVPIPPATPAAPVASLPAIPDAPPPLPQFEGVPAAILPAPPPPTPVPVAAPAVFKPGAPVLIGFPAGASTLPVSSLAALKQLKLQRGTHMIAITGYGDATSSDAKAQAAALPLALDRARAVAANLLAAGVPSSMLKVNAEAQGHGASALIVSE